MNVLAPFVTFWFDLSTYSMDVLRITTLYGREPDGIKTE
jgi:hypothetical protein